MVWFVGGVMAVGAGVIGVLLTRVERVRIQYGQDNDAPGESDSDDPDRPRRDRNAA